MRDGSSEKREAYEDSLKDLRRGIGCTAQRLEQHPRLHEVLTDRVHAQHGRATPELLLMEVTRLVESIEDPKFRGSLQVALRLDIRYRQHSLQARRERYNEDLLRSPDPDLHRLYVDSPRTMERRENRAIDLVAHLLSAGRPISPNGHVIDSPLRPIAPQGELAVEAISFHCVFSDAGVLLTQDTLRWVRATSPRSDPELTVTHRYLNDDRQGLLAIESVFGCQVIERRETVSGDLFARIRIHRDLAPKDGPYSFGSRLSVTSSVRSRPVVTWRPRTGFTKRIEFHLRFPDAYRPARAWWFHSPREVEGELEPPRSEGRHLEEYDGGNYLYRIFENEDISPHMHYGISWVWPNEGMNNGFANFSERSTAMENDG